MSDITMGWSTDRLPRIPNPLKEGTLSGKGELGRLAEDCPARVTTRNVNGVPPPKRRKGAVVFLTRNEDVLVLLLHTDTDVNNCKVSDANITLTRDVLMLYETLGKMLNDLKAERQHAWD
jgi:hypothetical protein